MLVGRLAEQRELETSLENARGERSGALVLRGEAGIGKTALLEHAEDHASGMRVLRCVGVEAEYEMPFAGLHRLVRPCMDLIDRLPDPQSSALGSALGLSSDGVDDRFLVSLGTLSLLAEAGEQTPLLCCIDDAQWLDIPSAEALAFAARRLEAERIAMVFAVREGDVQSIDLPGVPELGLEPLSDTDARELITARLDRGPSGEVLAHAPRQRPGQPARAARAPRRADSRAAGGSGADPRTSTRPARGGGRLPRPRGRPFRPHPPRCCWWRPPTMGANWARSSMRPVAWAWAARSSPRPSEEVWCGSTAA